jgi:hypothetical protein
MFIQRAEASSKGPSVYGLLAVSTGQGMLDFAGQAALGRKSHYSHAAHTHRARGLTAQFSQNTSSDPVPIPGGDFIPGFGVIHNFLSGPSDLTFEGVPLDGLDVEPGGITNFRGFIAQAYLESDGGALGNDGVLYDFASDIRVMQGEYVSLDGTHHRGTFVVI